MIRSRDSKYRVVTFSLACIALSVISSAAFAQSETPAPRPAVERRAAISPENWRPHVSRTFSLADLGFSTPLLFNGAELNRQIFFPIPSGLELQNAEIDLSGTYVRSTIGHLTFLTSLNDDPIFAFEPTTAEGRFQRTIKVQPNEYGARSDFLAMGLKYSSLTSENRCSEQRSIANVVAVSPNTNMRYDVAAKDVTDIGTAWRMLPQTTRILIPRRDLTPDEYRAALRIAMAAADTRRTTQFVTLPEMGETASTTDLSVPAALGRIRAFNKFSSGAASVRLDTPADRAAYGLLMSIRGKAAFGDTIVGHAWLEDIITQDMDALRKEIAQDGLAAMAAFDAWVETGLQPRAVSKDDNLKLVSIYGQPVISFDTDNASAAAGLVGSVWSSLAQTDGLTVGYASEAQDTRTWIPLSEMSANLAPISITEYGDWTATLNASKLPVGRWPTTIELEVKVSPDASEALPVLSVIMNDVLLRAEQVTKTDEIIRLTADVPSYLLSSTNTIRIAVQRATSLGDCRSLSRGYLAQVLPTSRVVLSDVKVDDQFFGLKSQMSKTGTVAIPTSYLQNATESLPFANAFLRALGFTPTSLRIQAYTKPEEFNPVGAFVAFGIKLPGLRRDIVVEGGELKLTSKTGDEAVQVTGAGNMAVVQISNLRSYAGVTVNTITGAPLRDVKIDNLAAGDLGVFNEKGQVLLLGESDYRIASLSRALLQPAAIFHRYSVWIVSGISIIFMLVFMRLVRALLDRRKRLKAEATPEAATPPA